MKLLITVLFLTFISQTTIMAFERRTPIRSGDAIFDQIASANGLEDAYARLSKYLGDSEPTSLKLKKYLALTSLVNPTKTTALQLHRLETDLVANSDDTFMSMKNFTIRTLPLANYSIDRINIFLLIKKLKVSNDKKLDVLKLVIEKYLKAVATNSFDSKEMAPAVAAYVAIDSSVNRKEQLLVWVKGISVNPTAQNLVVSTVENVDRAIGEAIREATIPSHIQFIRNQKGKVNGGCDSLKNFCTWNIPLYNQNDESLTEYFEDGLPSNSRLCAPTATAMMLSGVIDFFGAYIAGWTNSNFVNQNVEMKIKNVADLIGFTPENGTSGESSVPIIKERASEILNLRRVPLSSSHTDFAMISDRALQSYLQKPVGLTTSYGHYSEVRDTVQRPSGKYIKVTFERKGGHVIALRGYQKSGTEVEFLINDPWYGQTKIDSMALLTPGRDVVDVDGESTIVVTELPRSATKLNYYSKQSGSLQTPKFVESAILFQREE